MSLQSLKEAVLEIVADIEQDAKSYEGDEVGFLLQSYAKQLKRACKAAGDDPPLVSPQVFNPALPAISPMTQHILEVEKAKEEFRRAKSHHKVEEDFMGRMVEIFGSEPPEYASIHPDMPEGSMTQINGKTYTLHNNKLREVIIEGGK